MSDVSAQKPAKQSSTSVNKLGGIMQNGLLKAFVVSVPELLSTKRYDGDYVMVHGVYGLVRDGANVRRHQLSPKVGSFDGLVSPKSEGYHPDVSILLEDDNLSSQMDSRNLSPKVGGQAFIFDALFVGRFDLVEKAGSSGALSNLWMGIFQTFAIIDGIKFIHKVSVFNFDNNNLPVAPWKSSGPGNGLFDLEFCG